MKSLYPRRKSAKQHEVFRLKDKDLIRTRLIYFENIALKDGVLIGSLTNVDLKWNTFAVVPLYY